VPGPPRPEVPPSPDPPGHPSPLPPVRLALAAEPPHAVVAHGHVGTTPVHRKVKHADR
jgi:hypothetical protein